LGGLMVRVVGRELVGPGGVLVGGAVQWKVSGNHDELLLLMVLLLLAEGATAERVGVVVVEGGHGVGEWGVWVLGETGRGSAAFCGEVRHGLGEAIVAWSLVGGAGGLGEAGAEVVDGWRGEIGPPEGGGELAWSLTTITE
jgi:hypothetical protein